MPENHDKLTLTLDALRSDVERNPLADSQTVRRRGEQRTRRQAVGGALAVVALVAGAAGVVGGVGGSNRAEGPIATDGPTASTEVETPLAVAAQPLLAPADLGAVGPYSAWQLSPDPENVGQPFHLCVPSPTTLGAGASTYGHFYGDLDASATEHVLQFADSAGAKEAGDQLVSGLTACDLGAASDNVVTSTAQPVPLPAADEGRVVTREASPPGSDVSYYELGVVREANVLVVLQWNSMGLPDGVTQVWDAERMQAALDRAHR
ncbi:MAG: hypothetical protein ABI807_07400 [Sporichthyaceae bacterium]